MLLERQFLNKSKKYKLWIVFLKDVAIVNVFATQKLKPT